MFAELNSLALEDPAMASVHDMVMGRADAHTHADRDALICAYESLIPALERALWAHPGDPLPLAQYQAAHRQMEQLIADRGDDARHKFVIVIPVADRPQHLASCLDSLLRLCELYAYGGCRDGRYRKVAVFIADDSKDEVHMARNREMARDYTQRGIETLYFGLREQIAVVEALTSVERERLARVIGNPPRDAFWHKGPSLMRNIAFLKLRELWQDTDERLLFHFIDSDQEFRVKVPTAEGDLDLYAISYYHQLDRLFTKSDATVATGKVVGDPPVSPAVMASNFLDDVTGFLQRMAMTAPGGPCQFHAAPEASEENGASYHDMADLFGFAPTKAPFDYRCDLSGAHANADCLRHFAGQLNRFFFGEHPTRKTRFAYQGAMDGTPARTVYTGNYVARPEALRYFIPFAPLRLRMAGPVLGRLIQAELGARFVSANFPMLHQRTVRSTGRAEFRPGIDDSAGVDDGSIDLSGEFERQFYGDVMLFAIEKLAAAGYPKQPTEDEAIMAALETTRGDMLATYNRRQQVIGEKLARLQASLDDPATWWNRSPEGGDTVRRFRAFAANIERNFGAAAEGYTRINAASEWHRRRETMADAIWRYAEDRAAWEAVLFRA